MAIEVRQMVVKSNVLQRSESAGQESGGEAHLAEEVRNEIHEECRKLVIEMLRDRGER